MDFQSVRITQPRTGERSATPGTGWNRMLLGPSRSPSCRFTNGLEVRLPGKVHPTARLTRQDVQFVVHSLVVRFKEK